MEAEQPGDVVVLRLASPQQTQAVAARLGQVLQIGDVLALSGDLGAGKTTFVQGLAQGLGVPPSRHVASPTFALANEHPGRIGLLHVDFYRIRTTAELPELGLEEAFDRGATAIEWAERFPDWLPDDALHIRLEIAAQGARILRASSSGQRSATLLRALSEDPSAG
jgi:tRNA threonylcarbamoyladenosine biosynthesis protein TsaE